MTFSGLPACSLTRWRHRLWHGHSPYIQGCHYLSIVIIFVIFIFHHRNMKSIMCEYNIIRPHLCSTDPGGVSRPHHEHIQCNSVTKGISNACQLQSPQYTIIVCCFELCPMYANSTAQCTAPVDSNLLLFFCNARCCK